MRRREREKKKKKENSKIFKRELENNINRLKNNTCKKSRMKWKKDNS